MSWEGHNGEWQEVASSSYAEPQAIGTAMWLVVVVWDVNVTDLKDCFMGRAQSKKYGKQWSRDWTLETTPSPITKPSLDIKPGWPKSKTFSEY